MISQRGNNPSDDGTSSMLHHLIPYWFWRVWECNMLSRTW